MQMLCWRWQYSSTSGLSAMRDSDRVYSGGASIGFWNSLFQGWYTHHIRISISIHIGLQTFTTSIQGDLDFEAQGWIWGGAGCCVGINIHISLQLTQLPSHLHLTPSANSQITQKKRCSWHFSCSAVFQMFVSCLGSSIPDLISHSVGHWVPI